MALKRSKYRSFTKPDYQILENHMVFRGAKVDRSGDAVTGYTFDNYCNQFCKMIDNGEIKDLGNHLYEKTSTEDASIPEKFEFDVSKDIIMAPIYLFGCENLYVPINADEYLKYHMAKIEYDKPYTARRKIKNEEYSAVNKTDDSYINVCHIGKAVGDIPLKLGVNTRTYRILNRAPYNTASLDVMLHVGAIQCLTSALNDYYRECGIDSCAFLDIMRIKMTDDEWYEAEDEDSEERLNKIQNAIINGERIEPDEIVNLISPMSDVDMIIHFPTNEYRCFKGYNNPIENLSNRWSVYIRIPETNIWQLLNQDQYGILKRIEKLNVVYSRVDKPRFFDKVFYSTDHSASDLPNILRLCALLCLDLDYTYFTDKAAIGEYIRRKYTSVFRNLSDNKDKSYLIPTDQQTYEALTISVEQFGVVADVTMTQKELGICVENYSGYQMNNNSTGGRRRNDFCLINLIMSIADLQYSMTGECNGPFYYH